MPLARVGLALREHRATERRDRLDRRRDLPALRAAAAAAEADLFPFGVLPLHEYGVVARSYGLSFTLLMAVCAALCARRQRPLLIGVLLALLANTNAHSLMLAAGLGLYWLLETLREREPPARRCCPRARGAGDGDRDGGRLLRDRGCCCRPTIRRPSTRDVQRAPRAAQPSCATRSSRPSRAFPAASSARASLVAILVVLRPRREVVRVPALLQRRDLLALLPRRCTAAICGTPASSGWR